MLNGCTDTTMKNRDEKIPGICITINTMESSAELPQCMIPDEIKIATLDDEHIGKLSELIFHSCQLAIDQS